MKKYVIISIVFLIIFTSFSIGITAFLILNNKPSDTISNLQAQTNSTEKITQKTAKLDEKYNLNDIKITEYTEKIDEQEFKYIQIDGLKDEEIEISINYNLKNDIKTKLSEIITSDNYNGDLYCYSFITGNFANVFSMYYYIDYKTKNDDVSSTNICENYDLTTGNRLKLNDVIIDTQEMRQILSSKMYPNMINSITDIEYNEESWELKISNYNDIEEEIFKLINDFSNEKEINFAFSENSIIFLDYNNGNINFMDCLDYLTIYDKFNTKNIFDGKYNNLKDIPVLVKREYAQYQIVEKGENYYLDFSLFDDIFSLDAIEGKSSKPVEFVKERIQEMKKMANENPNTFYVFNSSYLLNEDGHFDDISNKLIVDNYNIYENSYIYETTKDFFETEMYPDIIKITRGTSDLYDIPYAPNNLFADYLYNYSPNSGKISYYNYYKESGEIELMDEYSSIN